MYDLEDLKCISEDNLVDRLELGNVCQLLAVADLYGAETVKAACQGLISNRKAEVVKSEAWVILKERNPTLAMEVLENI